MAQLKQKKTKAPHYKSFWNSQDMVSRQAILRTLVIGADELKIMNVWYKTQLFATDHRNSFAVNKLACIFFPILNSDYSLFFQHQ